MPPSMMSSTPNTEADFGRRQTENRAAIPLECTESFEIRDARCRTHFLASDACAMPLRARESRDAKRRHECPPSTCIRQPLRRPSSNVAGLTDFGPGRSKLFGNSADEYLKVHDRGPSQADVTEGSGGILGTPALRLVRSQSRRPHNDRLEHVGRRVRPHLHLHTSSRWFDRHRRSRRPRRQESQGTAARRRARDHRHGRFEKGFRKLGQGHRSPERPSKSGTLILSLNAATYPAATRYSDCGGELVPKDAESLGREDKPLLDLSSNITPHRRNHNASFTQTTGIR
jgi:hypothetical protein